jgi:acyl carrier protein
MRGIAKEESMLLRERVFRIISKVMDVSFEKVNERSSPDDLEKWDSLQHINLILALEEEFEVRFTDQEIVRMRDANAILETLRSKNTKA